MRITFTVVLSVFLAGCALPVPVVLGPAPAPGPEQVPVQAPMPTTAISGPSVAQFRQVVDRVLPVAIRACRARSRSLPCDYRIVVDDRPGQPANAFQTLDEAGRPVIGFTVALIEDARSADELAFVLGHEAAHHIAGHIPRAQRSASEGALVGGLLGAVLGLDPGGVETVGRLGATVGQRRFSKDFELEADVLGARIAHDAGYDPIRGVGFFDRLPDPGDRFLGTHPPNADRIAAVRAAVARF